MGSGKSGWLEIQWYTSTLVYADDVNTYIGWKCTYYKVKTKALLVVSMENRLEVNADKTKYIVISRD
jgi:hypothetical protein